MTSHDAPASCPAPRNWPLTISVEATCGYSPVYWLFFNLLSNRPHNVTFPRRNISWKTIISCTWWIIWIYKNMIQEEFSAISTEKSSLWRAGNSTSGAVCLNLFRTTMCNVLSECKTWINWFSLIRSSSLSPWFKPVSSFNALITLSWSFRTSDVSFKPGRSEIYGWIN